MLAGVGPLLGVIWDICNTTMATGLRVTDQYEPLRKALRYCHIKDAVRTEQGDLAYVPIGDGVCALRDALRLLRHDHPEIFLSFEHEKRWIPALPDPASAFAEYLRRMRPMIAEVA
jgi:sugar phosphate isomerase/epimerase